MAAHTGDDENDSEEHAQTNTDSPECYITVPKQSHDEATDQLEDIVKQVNEVSAQTDNLIDQLEKSTNQIETLISRVGNLEQEFINLREDASAAPSQGGSPADNPAPDPQDKLDIGETHRVVITDVERDDRGTSYIARIDGIVTFVDPNGFEVDRGDVVKVRLTDIKPNVVHALALTRE